MRDDDTASAIPGAAQLIRVVPQGATDTLHVSRVHQKLSFNLEQPSLPSGASVPTRNLHARCVSRS